MPNTITTRSLLIRAALAALAAEPEPGAVAGTGGG